METFRRLGADRARLRAALLDGGSGPRRFILLHPSFVCVALYRISHKLDRPGLRMLSRAFWLLNVVLTGSDLSPASQFGGGLLIVSPPGVALAGKAGRRLTVMPLAGLGGELGRREDVGAGPGLPVLGDDVIMGARCGVLGPVRIGNGAQIESGAVVAVDVPEGMVAHGPRARIMRTGTAP